MSLLVGLIEVLHFVICSSSLSQFWHPKVKNKIAPKSATVWNWAGHQLAINNSIKDIKRKRTQMKKIGSIRGGHLGEHGRSFKSILFESKSFPWVFKHPSVGWSKSADGVYKKNVLWNGVQMEMQNPGRLYLRCTIWGSLGAQVGFVRWRHRAVKEGG